MTAWPSTVHVDGEPPLKVLREYHAMTQQALADTAKVSTEYASQIERGTRQPSKKALAACAAALDLDLTPSSHGLPHLVEGPDALADLALNGRRHLGQKSQR